MLHKLPYEAYLSGVLSGLSGISAGFATRSSCNKLTYYVVYDYISVTQITRVKMLWGEGEIAEAIGPLVTKGVVKNTGGSVSISAGIVYAVANCDGILDLE